MHLNDESLMGTDAGAAGAAMAGPISNTVVPTQALRMLDADWIFIMGNSTMFFIETEPMQILHTRKHPDAPNCATIQDWKCGLSFRAPQGC
jgi:hypothetical protein